MEKIIKSFFITLASLIIACGAVVGCYFAIKGIAGTKTDTEKDTSSTTTQSVDNGEEYTMTITNLFRTF